MFSHLIDKQKHEIQILKQDHINRIAKLENQILKLTESNQQNIKEIKQETKEDKQ